MGHAFYGAPNIKRLIVENHLIAAACVFYQRDRKSVLEEHNRLVKKNKKNKDNETL